MDRGTRECARGGHARVDAACDRSSRARRSRCRTLPLRQHRPPCVLGAPAAGHHRPGRGAPANVRCRLRPRADLQRRDLQLSRAARGTHPARLWLCARYRFGEKPLFLCENGSGLYFASEIKALLRVPDLKISVNLEAVWDYLAYRYVPGPKTLFTGIRKLMPWTAATWERGKLKEERYWTAPDRSPHEIG